MQGQSYAGTSYKDEERLAFLADPRILDGQAAQTTIPNTIAFHTEDLDAYDFDCDDVANAKAVLMANLSNYGSDIILELEMASQDTRDAVTTHPMTESQEIKTTSDHMTQPKI
nr:hypothetical protein [Tanacetum cinerariifolium]